MNKLTFTEGKAEYFVRMPTQKDINEGDLVYKTKYSEALRYGALSAAEAQKIIAERDIWTRQDDLDVQELFMQLHALGDELMKTEKFALAANTIYEMEKVRTDILRLNMRKNNVLDNTAEAYADDHRLQFYCVACAFHKDGSQIFQNIDEYLERASEDIAATCMTKIIHLIANEGKDFRAEWPEFKWRVEKGLVDENLNPIQERMDEFITQASKELEAETKPKPKRRKRKTKAKTKAKK